MSKDEAFNRCWSKYCKEHSWNYMDEELSSDLAYYFWKSALEQPTQEPVAWMETYKGEPNNLEFTKAKLDGWSENKEIVPLYTHPKEWQGLSDVELSLLAEEYTGADGLDVVDYGYAIERALREKNHE